MESHDIPCWLSAGALIGYRWSGGMLPWDEDVVGVRIDLECAVFRAVCVPSEFSAVMPMQDFQCLASDLFAMELLAQRMREEPHKLPSSMQRYRLVINPHHVIRSIRQPQNTVDGRFVDTSTGLYIDIFALQKRDSAPRTLTIHKADGSPPVVKSSDPVLYSSKAPRQTPPFVHTYTEESLFPLQPCVFEGISIQCPLDVDRVRTLVRSCRCVASSSDYIVATPRLMLSRLMTGACTTLRSVSADQDTRRPLRLSVQSDYSPVHSGPVIQAQAEEPSHARAPASGEDLA